MDELTKQARARLIEKIQKCLALSASPEPHEAAAALRQAQKLMDKHGVTDRELGLAEYTSERVDCPIQANKTIPLQLSMLISLISRAFGVRATIHAEVRISDASYVVTYYGKHDRVILSAYTHPVVYRAMNGSWTKYLKRNPHLKGERGARGSFYVGGLTAVGRTVEDMALGAEEADILRKKLDEVCDSSEPAKVCDLKKYNQETLIDGMRKGRDFSLHRPIGG